ncbi:unnamed protein product [Didymodactylos carnosus]|uniref:RZ-type domain-containing protein n=1 Tax=Didymodactylos carnosus TaxID=1234261 RepID=A0A8S2RQ18_9BILA|nr:unnamed protein product [Didymodactylos carnosus]
MSSTEVHLRFIALNIYALLLSSKSARNSTYVNSLLYSPDRKMPADYHAHMMKRCLPGLNPNDSAIVTQMRRVKTGVQERLNKKQIMAAGKFIYQCSKNCYFMYYFEDCGMPRDRSSCPLCKCQIGSTQLHGLIQRNPPQIQMSIEEGFRAIDQYIAKYDQTNRHGYHVQPVKAENSTAGDTVDHLNPITFRLLHMFTHVMMMMLYQFKYIQQNENQLSYFSAHYEKDCKLIGDIISSPDDYPVWLYKIINHMMNANIHISGILDTNQNVVQFEKHIEQTLVFKHIQSISNEIKQYKVAFIDFVRKENAEPIFNDFVNELAENEEKYTLLNFFSVTKINNATLDEFRSTFQLLPYARNLYPLTDYILQHLPEIENLSLLFPLVQFCNLLLDKFNHRISRDDAATNDIGFYLTNNQDNILSLAFEQFR